MHYMRNNNDRSNIKKALKIAEYIDDKALGNKIAKIAARRNVVSTILTYPLLDLEGPAKKQSLILALIKQESGFDQFAVSSSGALGLMQLMPATAKETSRKLRLKYSKSKLRKQSEYNIALGSHYIDYLLKRFDNSYILAIASYNAGPSNTNRWLKTNGDIRGNKDTKEIIDWVEKISFSETRNYVQRVLENAIVYSHLLQKK